MSYKNILKEKCDFKHIWENIKIYGGNIDICFYMCRNEKTKISTDKSSVRMSGSADLFCADLSVIMGAAGLAEHRTDYTT